MLYLQFTVNNLNHGRMLIKFKKGEDKPTTLTCIRTDGSMTWTIVHPGMEIHDFAHFVVETELGFTDAFYGIIAKGFDIEAFELPREQRPEALIPANLPVRAHQTEHIVNLLQINFSNTDEPLDVISTLRNILTAQNIDFPEALNQERLDQINKRLKALLLEWKALKRGETLEIVFDTTV